MDKLIARQEKIEEFFKSCDMFDGDKFMQMNYIGQIKKLQEFRDVLDMMIEHMIEADQINQMIVDEENKKNFETSPSDTVEKPSE